LKNGCAPKVTLSEQQEMPMPNPNLAEALGIMEGNPQRLDADFISAMVSLPHICEASVCESAFASSDEVAGYDVRGR
jgi:hypothetical protein